MDTNTNPAPPARSLAPVKVCEFCGATISANHPAISDTSTSTTDHVFCCDNCEMSWKDTEYFWQLDDIDCDGRTYAYTLGKPRPKLYRATVSTYFGQVDVFTDYRNAELWVYNMFSGNTSQGDISRSIRINLKKGPTA
jgi:hypothetical protein